MRRITISIDEETYRLYKLFAAKTGVSLSAALRYGQQGWMELVGIDEVEPREVNVKDDHRLRC